MYFIRDSNSCGFIQFDTNNRCSAFDTDEYQSDHTIFVQINFYDDVYMELGGKKYFISEEMKKTLCH